MSVRANEPLVTSAETRPENVTCTFCTKFHKPDFALAVADAEAAALSSETMAAARAHGGVLSPFSFRHAAHRAATL